MDGISKEFQKVFSVLESVPGVAVEAMKEVVDEASETLYAGLENDVPVRTGGLRRSLKKAKASSPDWYGYKIEFEGNAPNGEPYQKIANVLNYGRGASETSGGTAGEHFIEKNVRKLRGLNDKIEARFEAKINKKTT